MFIHQTKDVHSRFVYLVNRQNDIAVNKLTSFRG